MPKWIVSNECIVQQRIDDDNERHVAVAAVAVAAAAADDDDDTLPAWLRPKIAKYDQDCQISAFSFFFFFSFFVWFKRDALKIEG
jgi:hypothetical protein